MTIIKYYTYWDEPLFAEVNFTLNEITKLVVALIDGSETVIVYAGNNYQWIGKKSSCYDYMYEVTGGRVKEWLEWQPDQNCLYPYPDQRLQKFTGVNINEPRN